MFFSIAVLSFSGVLGRAECGLVPKPPPGEKLEETRRPNAIFSNHSSFPDPANSMIHTASHDVGGRSSSVASVASSTGIISEVAVASAISGAPTSQGLVEATLLEKSVATCMNHTASHDVGERSSSVASVFSSTGIMREVAVASAISGAPTGQGLVEAALLEKSVERSALSSDSSTPCVCVRAKNGGKKVVDMDNEAAFDTLKDCAQKCPKECVGKTKYMLDVHDAQELGIPDVQESMSASTCKEGQCKCMDVHETVKIYRKKERSLEAELRYNYATPDDCLLNCKCNSNEDIGLCLSYWNTQAAPPDAAMHSQQQSCSRANLGLALLILVVLFLVMLSNL